MTDALTDLAWLLPLGLFAGLITTVAGLGGGMVMTLALSAIVGPQRALATAAPALLLGNAHRVGMYRKHLDRGVWRFVVGALPGALVGGALAVSLPELVLQVLLVGVAALAVAREVRRRWPSKREKPAPRANELPGWVVLPGSFGAGVVTATSGGGGLLLGPLLLMTGHRLERFVAAASTIALSMHVARIAAYGAGGLVTRETLAHSLALALTVLAGNLLGRHARRWLSDARANTLTYAVLLLCVGLSVAGLR